MVIAYWLRLTVQVGLPDALAAVCACVDNLSERKAGCALVSLILIDALSQLKIKINLNINLKTYQKSRSASGV